LTSLPTNTPTLTPIIFYEPEECRKPTEDYTRVLVNGQWINKRTLDMLQYAAELYGGNIDITGFAITQGSYTNEVPESFGTHAGGGVVDISVIARVRFEILYDEIPPLISALRVAGFAAWLREVDELGPGSPIHIHAVAIGDDELSYIAQEQLIGPFGYFRGYNGLIPEDGIPINDPHNGPIICNWMIDEGYSDLRYPGINQ
jgi:hypothetical protein